MPAEARVTSIWKKQKLFIAVFLLAFAGYFFYDGAIGYPAADRRYHEWRHFYDAGQLDQWSAVAQQHGWKVDEWQKWMDDPHQQGKPLPPDFRGRGKYLEQFICGTFSGLLGLVALAYWLSQKGRTVRTDETAVYSPAGTKVPFDSITGLGKKEWDSKGLATVLYEISGRKGRFKLDDYKFDRDATHQILAEIEEKLLARTPSS